MSERSTSELRPALIKYQVFTRWKPWCLNNVKVCIIDTDNIVVVRSFGISGPYPDQNPGRGSIIKLFDLEFRGRVGCLKQ